MNYLKQIIAFDRWEELHPLSDKAYRLWFKLMAIANTSGWDEWLSVPLLKLKSELHTPSDQTVMNARNALIQAGRIEVRKGKHGKSADYRLIPFKERPFETANVAASRKDSGVDHGVDSGAYYKHKQNKTKQDKTISHGSKIHDKKESLTKSKKSKRYAPDSTEYRLAVRLRDGIMRNNPDHRKITDAQLQKWADVVRLMIERDNRTADQVGNMIDWSQNNDFWATNILSVGALRRNYDKMKVRATKEWKQDHRALKVQKELKEYADQYPI